MPTLTWNEIRNRAVSFAADWGDETSERAEAQTFWNEFLDVFGVRRRRVAVYEKRVATLTKQAGRIDLFWPGVLLAEHKSKGQDLDSAYTQATDYFAGLKDDELPRYVIVSDFARIRLHDLDSGRHHEFPLRKLPEQIARFGFIAGYGEVEAREEDPVNQRAVVQLGELHDALKQDGYGGRNLEVFLVRLLFCLFADDTGIFIPKDAFLDLIESHTREDGSDTGPLLAKLFQVLNTDHPQRQKSLDETLASFPYVNGKLFEDALPIPEFNSAMREQLLACCRIQWAAISPAIFGAMFQKIIELDAKDRRRQLGAHYTSEANILKVIGPLFLDELRAEFGRVKTHKDRLFEFHKQLARLNFLDPACGCGNFLVVTYRELRRLERDVLLAASSFGTAVGGVFAALQVNVDQFHGIEIEEFPAQIAQVAMWLADHQMNLEVGSDYGQYFSRIPLTKSANIRCGNALQLDWEAFVPPARLSYILGNPPFIGKHYRSDAQRADLETVAYGMKAIGDLDYVAGWYLKAAHYLSGVPIGALGKDRKQFVDASFGQAAPPSSGASRHLPPAGEGIEIPSPSGRGAGVRASAARALSDQGIEDLFLTADRALEQARQKIRCAFVSTNSICQGEQVGVLWSELLRLGMKIQFAHRTFKWSNEAPGKAAVHCIIVGFGREDEVQKRLFSYADPKSGPAEAVVDSISPYLLEGPNTIVAKRQQPLWPAAPIMRCGNKPTDGGHLLLTPLEKEQLLVDEPQAAKFVRRFVGSEEFINGIERYCLWLVDAKPAELKAMPLVMKRVEAVSKFRAASTAAPTRKAAQTPTQFFYLSQPTAEYILIPEVSSERRRYVPLGFLPPDIITSNKNYIIAEPSLFLFGMLQSAMHMEWMRLCAGRLESRYQYSGSMVYNTFPWPQKLSATQRTAIEDKADAVLAARAEHVGATLAQLYDPLTMPPNLLKAHQALDRAVDAAYVPDGGAKTYASDAERVAFLFRRYAALTSLV